MITTLNSQDKIIPFQHHQWAHCESGTTVNLLNYHGIKLSEPLVFGIGAGVFFGHVPFLKVGGLPATIFRIWPGQIFKRVCKQLGIGIKVQKFGSEAKGMQALDQALAQNQPVGMLSSVYYLSYLPEAFRFHFNAHNLIVHGKEGSRYKVSDPIMEELNEIEADDLERARFAKGLPQPKGKMYYITKVPEKIQLESAIRKGIKKTIWYMFSPPMPWFGLRAIPYLAKQIKKYPQKLSPRAAHLHLGNIIRMQEEIGTGGGGFRYLYAAFLQEASQILQEPELNVFSQRYNAIGDQWRNFAFEAAKICKERNQNVLSYEALSELLLKIGKDEKQFYADLKKYAQRY